MALAGLGVGLALTEGVFALRGHRAFPHLNTYVADPQLGVRLRPGATERVVVGKNPITHVRINAQGFRGADFPSPHGDEIVVVGDSQVFGLGVEENETASAVLGQLTNATVLDAGVPTYGPLEYNQIARELLATYHPSTLVYVINFANDLFEAARPNTDRHAVWDGWAVRIETAPQRVTQFPGRALLFRESHAFFALRTFLYRRGEQLDDHALPSEGTFRDLVGDARSEHDRAARDTETLASQRESDIESAAAKEIDAEMQFDQVAVDALHLRGTVPGRAYLLSLENPGDIVVGWTLESEGGPGGSARAIINGAQLRKKVEADIRDRIESGQLAGADPWAWSDEKRARVGASLEQRDLAAKKLADLRAAPLQIVRARSPLLPALREAKAICDQSGTRLLVVALPMDLMVSSAEWAKYGGTDAPVDMSEAQILVDDVVESARAIGASALDATPALRAAEPGAFLDGDIHLTPKGQHALAEAIAAALADPSVGETTATEP